MNDRNNSDDDDDEPTYTNTGAKPPPSSSSSSTTTTTTTSSAYLQLPAPTRSVRDAIATHGVSLSHMRKLLQNAALVEVNDLKDIDSGSLKLLFTAFLTELEDNSHLKLKFTVRQCALRAVERACR